MLPSRNICKLLTSNAFPCHNYMRSEVEILLCLRNLRLCNDKRPIIGQGLFVARTLMIIFYVYFIRIYFFASNSIQRQ